MNVVAAPKARPILQRSVAFEILRIALVLVAALILIALPFWLLVINSVKPFSEAAVLGPGLPQKWQIKENYQIVIDQGQYWQGLKNSLLTDIPPIALTLFLASMAAWIFGRARTRAVNVVYFVVILGMLVPGAIVTSVKLLQVSGLYTLYGDRFGTILFYTAGSLPFVIFLMAGFVKTIPIELEEAARIEGAGSFRIYWQIVLPLLKPILASAAILLLLGYWNDFYTPFFLLPNPEDQTLPLGLFAFATEGQYTTYWNLVFADVVLVSLPLVLVYIFAQRWIIAGLTLGGVKG